MEEYKPLANLQVQILEAAAALEIIVDDIPDIKTNCTSIPIKVELEVPVYNTMSIVLSTTTPVQDDLITFSPPTIEFENGDQIKYFNITTIVGCAAGFVHFEI